MKQTFNVNIGGRAYNIDADAYELLDRYLGDISSRLSDSDVDSMEDIEARISDIFGEKISSGMQVVNIDMVRRAMAVIGRPEMFGGQKREFSYQSESHQGGSRGGSTHHGAAPNQSKRLFRSWKNRVIGGVCGGVGEYFDIDPNVIRLVSALLIFFGGLSLWVYLIMWIVLPQAPVYYDK
jgi:phage shock protein PspC (stress-responsive transcriptional regulator)